MKQPTVRLSARQQRFVEEYLIDLSAVDAARRAGYAARTAAESAGRLLRSPAVCKAISRAQEERSRRTGVSQEHVVRELAAVGFAVMTDICHWTGEGVHLNDSAGLTRGQAAAIAEVRESGTARGGVQVKLHSKLKALEMLGRHLGMFGNGQGDPSTPLAPDLPDALRRRIASFYGGDEADGPVTDDADEPGAADSAP